MSDDPEPADQLLPGDRGWKPGEFTELRVHGVGNTEILWLLDDPAPKQVAGDDVVGFYRSRIDRPLILDPRPEIPPPDGPCQDERLGTTPVEAGSGTGQEGPPNWRDGLRSTDVEAYDWGGFNTGGGWRAMWLLLLPFTLANVAGWLVPGRRPWAQRWVRLFALGISLLFVTWLGAMVIDLIAIQCGWQEACYDRQFFLKLFGVSWFPKDPADRVALILLVPLAVLFVLWMWPGRRSHDKYEAHSERNQGGSGVDESALDEPPSAISGPDDPSSDQSDDDPTKSWLPNPDIWIRTAEVRSDAVLHGSAVLATLGLGVAWANWKVKGGTFDLYLVYAGVLLLVASCSVVFFSWSPLARDKDTLPTSKKWLVRTVGWLAIAFMAAVVAESFLLERGYAAVDWSQVTMASAEKAYSPAAFQVFLDNAATVQREGRAFSDHLQGALFKANGLVLGVPLLALIVSFFLTSAHNTRNRRLWRGGGPLVLLLTGLAVSSIFVAGAGLWLEEWLGDRPSEHFEALGVNHPACGLEDSAHPEPACSAVPLTDGDDEELRTTQKRLDALIKKTGDLRVLPLLVFTAAESAEDNGVLAQPVIKLHSIYDLVALVFIALVLMLALLAGILEARLSLFIIRKKVFPVRRALRDLAQQELEERTDRERKRWTKIGTRELRKSPRLTRLHLLLWVPASLIFGFGVFLFLDQLGSLDQSGISLARTIWLTEFFDKNAPWAFTVSRWSMTAAVAVAATLVYRSYSPKAQEQFGGMWDVISFLPRHYHPFAVPSYGDRAVPELVNRITILCHADTETKDDPANQLKGRCLVSAHSGGVVISLAAISLLRADVRRHVSLVTYGSPTGALYGRTYPEYYDPHCLARVASGLGEPSEDVEKPPVTIEKVRWFNLWRLTDWTGGYSFGPPRDRFKEYLGTDTRSDHPKYPISPDLAPLIDHVERIQYDPACRTLRESSRFDPLPVAIGHTDYLHDGKHIGPEDPRYQDARGALLQMLPDPTV